MPVWRTKRGILTIDDYNKAKLAELAWKAAGKISFPACVAVAFCIRNRVEKAGDNNWLKAMSDDTDTRDPDFARLIEVIDSIYTGERVDNLSNNALYWDDGKGRERVAVIGPDLVLYK